MAKQKKKKISKKEDNTLAIITHLLGIFTYVIGPLIVYLSTKDKEVRKHARNAINWQISLIIYALVVAVFLGFVQIMGDAVSNVFVIFPFSSMLSLLGILNIVFCIIAAVKANEGILWEYPLTIEVIN